MVFLYAETVSGEKEQKQIPGAKALRHALYRVLHIRRMRRVDQLLNLVELE